MPIQETDFSMTFCAYLISLIHCENTKRDWFILYKKYVKLLMSSYLITRTQNGRNTDVL